MTYVEARMFYDAIPMLRAQDTLQMVNAHMLANGDSKRPQWKKAVADLERAANAGTRPVVKRTTMEQRKALLQGVGVKVTQYE